MIPNLLLLTYAKNDGGAFGLLGGYRTVLLIGSAAAIAFVLWMLLEGPPRTTTLGCGFILGGAGDNLLDRLTASEVTDYIDLRVWPVFNAADVAIVVGVAVLLITALRSGNHNRPPAGDQRKAQG